MTRRARASEIIRAALTPPPASRAEAERLVRDAYPWADKGGHPYKAWCEVRADVLAEIYGTRYYTGPEWIVSLGDERYDVKPVCTNLFAAESSEQDDV